MATRWHNPQFETNPEGCFCKTPNLQVCSPDRSWLPKKLLGSQAGSSSALPVAPLPAPAELPFCVPSALPLLLLPLLKA